VLCVCACGYVFVVAGIANDLAWSCVIVGHALITYWLIHYKRGSLLTWDDDGGKYDGMTYWEQVSCACVRERECVCKSRDTQRLLA
jgi:hypothetical protein